MIQTGLPGVYVFGADQVTSKIHDLIWNDSSQIYPSCLSHTETLGLLIREDAMNGILELPASLKIVLKVGWWRSNTVPRR